MEEWRDISEELIVDLAENMREKDREEIFAFTGYDPYTALKTSHKYSVESGAWVVDGRVACMAGVARPTVLSDINMPWLLSSDVVPVHSRRFLRGTKVFVDNWKSKYKYMMNFVDSRYDEAIRWVEWLGFTVHPKEYDVNGVIFYKFDMVN